MNCEQLRQDILNYKERFAELRESFDQIREDAKKPQGFDRNLLELDNTTDELISKYLTDFQEKFPGLKNEHYLGDRIDGFEGNILSLLNLPSGRILAAGEDGETRVLAPDQDGQLSFGNRIKNFNSTIETLTPISDNQVLVASFDNEARILTFDENNKAVFSEEIGDLKFSVCNIVPVGDGRFLAGTINGRIKAFRIDSNSNVTDWKLIEGFYKTLFDIIPLSQECFLVTGHEMNKVLSTDKDNQFSYGDEIKEIKINIKTHVSLPDGRIFIASEDGKAQFLKFDDNNKIETSAEPLDIHNGVTTSKLLRDGRIMLAGYESEGGKKESFVQILSFDENDNLISSETIEGFKNGASASTILPDGNILIAGGKGEARVLSPALPNARAFRVNLDKILEMIE